MKKRRLWRRDVINVAVLLGSHNEKLPCVGCGRMGMVLRFRTIAKFETACCRKRVYPDAETLIRLLPETEVRRSI